MKTIACNHDTDVPVEEWPVRPYSKSELARAYAPEIGERSALNRLSRWLRGNVLLYQALQPQVSNITSATFKSSLSSLKVSLYTQKSVPPACW